MSKKSRKRNKKILAVLAAGLGAAALAIGKKGAVTAVVNPNLSKASVAADVATDVADTTGSYLSRMGGAGDRATQLANQVKRANQSKIVRGIAPPSQLISTARPNRFNRLKGGGIAKRGMGAAFKSGGRVKSMGIAKRGGGAAKR